MRAKNLNTMYHRRAVRPDRMVYRRMRKIDRRRRRILGLPVAPVSLIAAVALLVVALSYMLLWR
jgi:hypothetical protein